MSSSHKRSARKPQKAPLQMNVRAQDLFLAVKRLADPVRARHSQRFYKSGPGQYAEGDRFLGLTMPQTRSLVAEFDMMSFEQLKIVLASEWHEVRMLGSLILIKQYESARDAITKEKVFRFFFMQRRALNNWDLIDVSVPRIAGHYFLNRDSRPLYKLARSANLWERRFAVLAAGGMLRFGESQVVLDLCRMLLGDEQDLIHKACGWMLREVGKKNLVLLREFLARHSRDMPRTMLRYSIEKLSSQERIRWMKR